MRPLIIVPAYNEEATIGPLIDELQAMKPAYDFIVIDDASVDRTWLEIQKRKAPCLHVLFNIGLPAVMKLGMLYALQEGYDACIQIDGDGQHRLCYIQPLLAKLSEGYDIAIGSRFLERGSYRQTFLRAWGARWLGWLIRLQTGLQLTDPTSGMRAYNKRACWYMCQELNARPDPDTIALFFRGGYRICEIPVEMNERMGGRSHFSGWYAGFRYMLHTSLALLLNTQRRIK